MHALIYNTCIHTHSALTHIGTISYSFTIRLTYNAFDAAPLQNTGWITKLQNVCQHKENFTNDIETANAFYWTAGQRCNSIAPLCPH